MMNSDNLTKSIQTGEWTDTRGHTLTTNQGFEEARKQIKHWTFM